MTIYLTEAGINTKIHLQLKPFIGSHSIYTKNRRKYF